MVQLELSFNALIVCFIHLHKEGCLCVKRHFLTLWYDFNLLVLEMSNFAIEILGSFGIATAIKIMDLFSYLNKLIK